MRGFSLVELLTVITIMAIIMGAFALSLGGQSRGVQMAAAQVSSGLGLARQTAISRNTDAMFLIAHRRSSGSANFFPTEPFRYWTVVYSNRLANTWTLAKDWTELPAGTVFMGLSGQGYNTISWSSDGSLPPPGTPFTPQVASSSGGNWQFFNSFTNCNVVWNGGSENLSGVPFMGFRADGRSFCSPSADSHAAVIVGEGAVTPNDQITLRSTNNITHIETDSTSGRTFVRPRDSYR